MSMVIHQVEAPGIMSFHCVLFSLPKPSAPFLYSSVSPLLIKKQTYTFSFLSDSFPLLQKATQQPLQVSCACYAVYAVLGEATLHWVNWDYPVNNVSCSNAHSVTFNYHMLHAIVTPKTPTRFYRNLI